MPRAGPADASAVSSQQWGPVNGARYDDERVTRPGRRTTTSTVRPARRTQAPALTVSQRDQRTPTGTTPTMLPSTTGVALPPPRAEAPATDRLPEVPDIRQAQYTRTGSSSGLTTAQLAIPELK